MTPLISDLDCEYNIIAYILTYSEGISNIGEYLSDEAFTEPRLREIYQAVVSLDNRGEKIDVSTVWDEMLSHNTTATLNEMLELSYYKYGGSVEAMAIRLRDLTKRRDLWHLGNIIVAQSNDSQAVTLDEIYDRMRDFLNNTTSNVQTTDLHAATQEVRRRIESNIKGDNIAGTKTGFPRLDEFGGLHKGDLVIVAGSTSHGKTSFALSITLHAIEAGEKIIYYSLEMDAAELTSRLLAIRSGVPAATIMYQALTDYDRQKVETAIDSLPKDNLLFDDKATARLETILSSIRSMCRRNKIKGAVVDYLQILNINTSNSRDNQEQLMAYAARRMKNLAKELGIWIMALSQLNREGGEKTQPTLSRLRNSGQIAEAADIVLLIYRPEMVGARYREDAFADVDPHNTALVDIAKGRNVGTGKFVCRFIPELTYFCDDPSLTYANNKQQDNNNNNEEETPF